MASGYGWRTDPFTKARKFHYGMDFAAPQGTPVYAAGDGVVVRADSNASGYGNHIPGPSFALGGFEARFRVRNESVVLGGAVEQFPYLLEGGVHIG